MNIPKRQACTRAPPQRIAPMHPPSPPAPRHPIAAAERDRPSARSRTRLLPASLSLAAARAWRRAMLDHLPGPARREPRPLGPSPGGMASADGGPSLHTIVEALKAIRDNDTNLNGAPTDGTRRCAAPLRVARPRPADGGEPPAAPGRNGSRAPPPAPALRTRAQASRASGAGWPASRARTCCASTWRHRPTSRSCGRSGTRRSRCSSSPSSWSCWAS
jgi:hypothetical protein